MVLGTVQKHRIEAFQWRGRTVRPVAVQADGTATNPVALDEVVIWMTIRSTSCMFLL